MLKPVRRGWDAAGGFDMNNVAIVTDAAITKFMIHGVPDRPGAAAEMFSRVGAAGINIHMMAASGAERGRTDISLTVADDDAARVVSMLESAKAELEASSVSQRSDVAAVSLVADGLAKSPGIAGRMFRTLSAEGINIDMISAANTAVTCLIDARFLEAATQALKREFRLELA
ncbi:MAG: ACT domain-containing protein [candidate division Zixibacteria bacterium]|nr:ACT domain-containing protein [candidate division Zixibacteria bacterium]